MGVTAADLGQIPMSPDLGATLARGAEFSAGAGAPEVTLEHLLAGLCDDPDAIAVLDASQVDIAALKADVISRFALEPGPHQPPDDFGVSQGVRRILEAAAAAARGSRRRDINGAIVLAAIVGDARSMAAEILQGHGLTFDSAIRALQTALAAPARAPAAPPQQQIPEDVLARARERVQSRSAPSLRDLMKDMPRPATPPQLSQEHAAHPDAAGDDSDAETAPPPSGYSAPSAAHTTQPAAQPNDASDSYARPVPAPPPPTHAPRHEPQPPVPQPASPSLYEFDDSETTLGTPAIPDAHESARPAAPRAEPSLSFPSAPPKQAGDRPSDPRGFAPPPGTPPHPGQAQPPRGMPLDLPRPVPQGAHPPPIPPPAPMAPPPGMRGRAADFGPPGGPAHGQFPGQPVEPSFGSQDRSGSQNTPTGLQADAPFEPPLGPPGAPASGRPLPRPPAPAPANRAPARKRGKRAKVEAGQLAENIPRTMRVGRTERVEIRIAKATVPALTEGLDGGGQARQHQIAITKAMSVRIRAPDGGFFIETASPETQWIENGLELQGDDFASWRFLITPQERGWATLQIVVSARTVGSEGVAAETALPDQVVEVKVRRNLKRMFARIFGWSVAAILGGALSTFGEGGMTAVKALLQRLVN